MNALRIVILAVLVTLFLPRAQAVESRMFGSAHLSSTRFTCIYQDRYGYIWVATEYGLNRFDGYRFTTYLSKPGNTSTLPHNHIVWIDADREGRLWVMTAKGLALYDYARDCFVRYDLMPGQEDKPRASRIVQDSAGRLWLGTSGYGLYEINRKRHAPNMSAISRLTSPTTTSRTCSSTTPTASGGLTTPTPSTATEETGTAAVCSTGQR